MLKLKQLLLLIIIQLSLSYEVSLLQLFLFAGIRMLSIFVLIFDLIFKQPGISIIENIISNFEYINIKITGQMIWPLALYFCSLLVFKLKPRQLVTGIITGILVFVLMIHFNGSVRIVFVDVQQGDATLLIAPYKQSVVLIDTGRKSQYYALKKTLKKYGISKIDQLIITHADSDHNENKESLMKDFKVIEVIEDKQQKIDNPYFAFKSYLNSKNYDNENDNSLVFSINFNEASFLFLGDISKSVERDLILENPFLSASVLKLAHHGSKTSSDPYFIAQLKPDYAIISSDPKVYNHPHIEVLMTLAQYQIKTLKTYQESNIVFTYHQFFNWISTDKRFILLQ